MLGPQCRRQAGIDHLCRVRGTAGFFRRLSVGAASGPERGLERRDRTGNLPKQFRDHGDPDCAGAGRSRSAGRGNRADRGGGIPGGYRSRDHRSVSGGQNEIKALIFLFPICLWSIISAIQLLECLF